MQVHILSSRSYQWDPVVFDTKKATINYCVYNDLLDFVEVVAFLQDDNSMLGDLVTKEEMTKAFHGSDFDAKVVDLHFFLAMFNDDIVYQVGTHVK